MINGSVHKTQTWIVNNIRSMLGRGALCASLTFNNRQNICACNYIKNKYDCHTYACIIAHMTYVELNIVNKGLIKIINKVSFSLRIHNSFASN